MIRVLPEGFTEWRGGCNPAPGKRVRIVFAGSNVPARPIYESDKLDWLDYGRDVGGSIVAYRIEGEL